MEYKREFKSGSESVCPGCDLPFWFVFPAVGCSRRLSFSSFISHYWSTCPAFVSTPESVWTLKNLRESK